MMKRQLMLLIVLLLSMDPVSGVAEESVPRDSFIEITENILDQFNVLMDEARQGNFNQLKNPEIQAKFNRIGAELQEYEGYGRGSIQTWHDGRQKEVAERLHTTNFLYRAYSLSQHDLFREKAEMHLMKARELYQDYAGTAGTNERVYGN